jgi:ribosomal protein S7
MLYQYIACKWFNRFKSSFIIDGHKIQVESVCKQVLIFLKLKYRVSSLLFFYETLEKLRVPFILTRYHKGRELYFLPVIVFEDKQYKISIQWFVKTIKETNQEAYHTLLEAIIFRIEELILIDDTDEEDSSSTIIIENNNINKEDNIDESNITNKISISDHFMPEYNHALNFKWNVYKIAAKHRTYIHYRWGLS